MTILTSTEYQRVFDSAVDGDRLAMQRIFEIAEQLQSNGDQNAAVDAYQQAAIACRRRAAILESELLDGRKKSTDWFRDSLLFNKWVRGRPAIRTSIPVRLRHLNADRLNQMLGEISRDLSMQPLLEYVDRSLPGERSVMVRLQYSLERYFGIRNDHFLLNRVDLSAWSGIELVAKEVMLRFERFSPRYNPSPAMVLNSQQTFQYYCLLARLDVLYFEYCNQPSQSLSGALKHVLDEVIVETLLFCRELVIGSPCGTHLMAVLDNVETLLVDGAQNPKDFIEQELAPKNYYDIATWFSEPHYWNDEIGLAIDQLSIIYTSQQQFEDRDERVYAVSQMLMRAVDEGTYVFGQWRLLFSRKVGLELRESDIKHGYIELFEQSKIFAGQVLSDLECNERIEVCFDRLVEFAESRNDICLKIAQGFLGMQELGDKYE